MKLQKLLLSATMLVFMTAFGYAENSSALSTNGIEPVMESSYAPVALDLEKAHYAKDEKKGLGKFFSWVKKKTVKLVKKVAAIGGLGDPVDKWFWFWIIGWGAGILLTALFPIIFFSGGLSGVSIGWLFILLGSLAWIFGTVSLVVWLIKKFA